MLDESPLVSIEKLRVEFETNDGVVVGVKDVSFDIKPGECVCVVGESGSGKSVSSLSLMRLVEFGGGTITNGKLMFDTGDGKVVDLVRQSTPVMRDIRGNQIGMIFQEPMTALNPVFTVGDQLAEGLIEHRGLDKKAARARALEILKQVRIPEPERRMDQYPHELSGGMRQRVVIAIAMACEPRLLICDEPTTALDVTIQAEILALIDRLKREKQIAVLFITHDMAVVAQMADRVVVMYRGDKVEEGPVEQIFEAPREDYTRMLLAAVPRLGEMSGKPAPERLRLMRDGTVGKPEPIIVADPKPLLTVENLVTRFAVKGGIMRRTVANVHAVEDVSFTINGGETLSLVGESGCGKSTCGRSILRLVEPQSGHVNLGGTDVLALSQRGLRRARRDMQMIFQDPFASLDPHMKLYDQVAEPMLNYGIGNRSERQDRIAALFDRVELPRSFMRRYPHEMSGGQRQRIAIARAMVLRPRLVVLDEPTSALDMTVQVQIVDLLRELQRKYDLAYLFISHDLKVVRAMSHKIIVMKQGDVVEMGEAAEVFERPKSDYTRRLFAAAFELAG